MEKSAIGMKKQICSAMIRENELEHSGVLGMQWHRRRWQNLDGSLTPAGREHYGVGPARGTENDKYRSTDDLSNDELRERTERLRLQKEYDQARAEHAERSKSAVRKALEKFAEKFVDKAIEAGTKKLVDSLFDKTRTRVAELKTEDELKALLDKRKKEKAKEKAEAPKLDPKEKEPKVKHSSDEPKTDDKPVVKEPKKDSSSFKWLSGGADFDTVWKAESALDALKKASGTPVDGRALPGVEDPRKRGKSRRGGK